MPRMQVYLPEDLFKEVKTRQLRVSELLQQAVRAEVRRLDSVENTDTYLRELVADVGEPSAKELARAEAVARRVRKHRPAEAS